MLQKSLSFANYWRDSLADADLGKGGFRKKELSDYHQCDDGQFRCGQINDELVASLFEGEDPDADHVELVLRPFVFEQKLDHAKRLSEGYPEIVTPTVIAALVDRNGRLFAQGFTVVPRDLLDPLDLGSLSIGSVDKLDSWLTTNPHPVVDRHAEDQNNSTWHRDYWTEFLSYVDRLVASVTKDWPNGEKGYLKSDKWLLRKESKISGTVVHILPLYDHIQRTNPGAPLFDCFASEEELPPVPCAPHNDGFSLRVGHSSDTRALADAQRDAMTHHLITQNGEILGVNGPPGTGKTTLLLSIVASHMVQAAIDGGNPKMIAAASTNNQAVTNIIDSFAKDFSTGTGPFAGRWLPDIKSFGAYFPATDKEKIAASKYQTRSFFNTIESPEYLNKAKGVFLSAAKLAFADLPISDVQSAVKALQKGIRDYAHTLKILEESWQTVCARWQDVVTLLGTDPLQGITDLKNQIDASRALDQNAKLIRDKWEFILTGEKWWMTLFSWIPSVARRRYLSAKQAFTEYKDLLPNSCSTVEQISTWLDDQVRQTTIQLQTLEQTEARWVAALDFHRAARDAWLDNITRAFSCVSAANDITLADVDEMADTTIRFKAFLLATHYWEGRWLLDMEALLPKLAEEKNKTGETTVKPRWMRRMMVTPCMVSTFYMLPSEMKISRYDAGTYVPDYLFEFIDLLIVDEAGQVLPEVAAASFSLAKKALVIGDVLQIEPIWNVTTSIDVGNLLDNKLLDPNQIQKSYNRLCHLGKTASAGSVMRIAQCVSRYHYDLELARGMYLYEHHRCYDEIIDYCNNLCYRGKLIPKRGNAMPDLEFPAMGYLHVSGKCVQPSGGSRRNDLEAQTIAEWIEEHREQLEKRYSGTKSSSIEQIVGVVTPFGAQVAAITAACQAKNLNVGRGEGQLTVGTIHSLQGAARPVIIFSPTYSKHADGTFIDKKTSMLNVAVSRAKDSFLVFGDMDLFDPTNTSRPRGLLAKYLLASPNNALTFKTLARQDLGPIQHDFQYLVGPDAHDNFLLDVLSSASKEVHIASPWLRKHRMKNNGLLSAMASAVNRGIQVFVYADSGLHQGSDKRHWQEAEAEFSSAKIELHDVPRLHSKIVVKDNETLCIGSFNWLSAAREGNYSKHDTSVAYSGSAVGQEMRLLLDSLNNRMD